MSNNSNFNFNIEDINLFINSFERDLNSGTLINTKIPVYVEYLRTKRHYMKNNMDEDMFFNKRFQITSKDIEEIYRLIGRIKSGKSLNKNKDMVMGNTNSKTNIYNEFNEDEDEDNNNNNKFQLLSEVQSAMDAYNARMKKVQQSRNEWKKTMNNRSFEDNKLDNRFYTDGRTSQRIDSIEYNIQENGKAVNGSIRNMDDMDSLINRSNYFDEYKRNVPVMNSNRKNDEIRNMEGGRMEGGKMDNNKRFWQDQDIMANNLGTRKKNNEYRQPFEHQFQYIDPNYNQVSNIVNYNSRQDNRNYIR
jgi:hypothetical protein